LKGINGNSIHAGEPVLRQKDGYLRLRSARSADDISYFVDTELSVWDDIDEVDSRMATNHRAGTNITPW
jgi:hypothetical protein